MQALYNTTRDLKGKFKQVYTDTLYNRKRTSYGYLYVRKPGKMRWNYVKPERKAFISDGKVLWVWEPADKQAFRNPLDSKTLSTGLTFLLGSGDLLREFNVAYATARKNRLGGPSHLVLKLTPKVKTAQYKYLVLAVRPTDFAVEESMVVSKHSRNHFIFSRLKFNTRVGSRRFIFRPPKGTRVVDGSKLRRK
jgi:outer membrane lipoprotein carrier protein